MSAPVTCTCNKKEQGHQHHTWGGLPHHHGENKQGMKKTCAALHWYCYMPGCNCGGNPNANMDLVNKVIRESSPRGRRPVAA